MNGEQARAGRVSSRARRETSAGQASDRSDLAHRTGDRGTGHVLGSSVPILRRAVHPRSRQSGSYPRFGAEPALDLGDRHPLACGVVLDLVAGDQVDGEVAGLGVGEVEAADRRGRGTSRSSRSAGCRLRPRRRAAPRGSASRCGRGRTGSRPPGGCRGTSRRSGRPSRGVRRGRSPSRGGPARADTRRTPRPGGRPGPWP